MSCITQAIRAARTFANNQPTFLGPVLSAQMQNESSRAHALFVNRIINIYKDPVACAQLESLFSFIQSGSDCGNGVVDGVEECDFGVDNGGTCTNNCEYNCQPGDSHRNLCRASGNFDSNMCLNLYNYIQSAGGVGSFNAGDCTVYGVDATLCDRTELLITECAQTPVCGNGIVELGEVCDLGSYNAAGARLCGSSCKYSFAVMSGGLGSLFTTACQNSGFTTSQCADVNTYLGSLDDDVDAFDYYACRGEGAGFTNILCGVEEALVHTLFN